MYPCLLEEFLFPGRNNVAVVDNFLCLALKPCCGHPVSWSRMVTFLSHNHFSMVDMSASFTHLFSLPFSYRTFGDKSIFSFTPRLSLSGSMHIPHSCGKILFKCFLLFYFAKAKTVISWPGAGVVRTELFIGL